MGKKKIEVQGLQIRIEPVAIPYYLIFFYKIGENFCQLLRDNTMLYTNCSDCYLK